MITEIFLALGAVFFVVMGYKYVKHHPEAFRGELLTQASGTLARLALALMVGIVFCIYMLRQL